MLRIALLLAALLFPAAAHAQQCVPLDLVAVRYADKEHVVVRGDAMKPFVVSFNAAPGDPLGFEPDTILVVFHGGKAHAFFSVNGIVCAMGSMHESFARRFLVKA